MLHTKHYEVLELFTGDYNREIYGRELIGKVSMSQKGIALVLDELEQLNVLKSNKRGNMKYFKLNTVNTEIKDILKITELMKKIEIMKKHRIFSNLFKTDRRIVGIFGSYAKGTEKKDSDIDLFIIGDKKGSDYQKMGKIFDLNVSVKYFSEKEFTELIKQKNNLCEEIIKNHIVIFGVESLIEMIWGNKYGFDKMVP